MVFPDVLQSDSIGSAPNHVPVAGEATTGEHEVRPPSQDRYPLPEPSPPFAHYFESLTTMSVCSAVMSGPGHTFFKSRLRRVESGHSPVSIVLISTAFAENPVRAHEKKRVRRLLRGEDASQLLALRPACTVPVSDILEKLDLPDFLDDVTQHPSFENGPGLTNGDTRLNLWNSVQVRIPTSRFVPEARVARINAVSGLLDAKAKQRKKPLVPRADAVFYRPSNTTSNDELAEIHGEYLSG